MRVFACWRMYTFTYACVHVCMHAEMVVGASMRICVYVRMEIRTTHAHVWSTVGRSLSIASERCIMFVGEGNQCQKNDPCTNDGNPFQGRFSSRGDQLPRVGSRSL